MADDLVRQSVWIVGGDGWAYDIGAGGLDHVLASGRDVNVLVLDTEVYSNTGGQASKATPRGAIAKFAARGKATAKKDLGMQAMAYGNAYVAQVALGRERDADHPGVHRGRGVAGAVADHRVQHVHRARHRHGPVHVAPEGRRAQRVLAAVPLQSRRADGIPFHLDSKDPTMPLAEFAMQEARFAMLARAAPHDAERLMAEAQEDVTERWHVYRQLAGMDRVAPHLPGAAEPSEDAARRGGVSAVTDLSTTYLGLSLRTPLVASASPLHGSVGRRSPRGRTPVRRRWCCRRCSRSSSRTRRSTCTS